MPLPATEQVSAAVKQATTDVLYVAKQLALALDLATLPIGLVMDEPTPDTFANLFAPDLLNAGDVVNLVMARAAFLEQLGAGAGTSTEQVQQ